MTIASEVMRDILLKTAPDWVRVDFILTKKNLDEIADSISSFHTDCAYYVLSLNNLYANSLFFAKKIKLFNLNDRK